MSKYKKVGIYADLRSSIALRAYEELTKLYKEFIDIESEGCDGVDVIIAVGGDGMMLKALHNYSMNSQIPVYGLNRGSVGFLLNEYRPQNLLHRINNSIPYRLYPLEMTACDMNGKIHNGLAINEVSLLREINQSAKIKISIDGTTRLDCLIADGILLATPAGSSAYNFAANGPIIPLHASILALTPISPFRPRRWRGALLAHNSLVRFDILEAEKRPVSAVADSLEVRDVTWVEIKENRSKPLTILFDQDHNFDERILSEQFAL
jgi:NAD+ kinase